MTITTKIIITDTNIITDLNNAKILGQFVELDNVYISDLIKYDEINTFTCDEEIIKKAKTINATEEELKEISQIRKLKPRLSSYDVLNYILARDNKCILATGDNELKKFCEINGVEVIRTLKIIELMVEKRIISLEVAVTACELLEKCPSTRIPKEAIKNLKEKLEKDLVLV